MNYLNAPQLPIDQQVILDRADPRNPAFDGTVINKMFELSVDELITRHSILIRDNVSERTIAQRLSLILERRTRELGLDRHFADVEYNRLHGEMKYLPDDGCICGNLNGRERGHDNITADLILHGRGLEPRRYENVIAVEIKLEDDKADDTVYDRCRVLRMSFENGANLLTAQGYMISFFLVLRATRKRDFTWRYEDQVFSDPAATFKLGQRQNVGYFETFILGQSRGISVFDRPD